MSNEQTTVIRAKALITGADAPPVPNAVVVIRGDRIVAAGPEEAVDVPKGPDVRVLDHSDGYLLPGLIDAHTHLMFGAGERSYENVIENDSDELMLLRAARNAHTHLSVGVTALRGLRRTEPDHLRPPSRRPAGPGPGAAPAPQRPPGDHDRRPLLVVQPGGGRRGGRAEGRAGAGPRRS